MPRQVQRQPQLMTAREFLSAEAALPERIELVRGAIGPYGDEGMRTLLANWGADRVIEVTGPEVWCEALAAYDAKSL